MELTLTIPPTPVPTLPPTLQPTTPAAATSPDEAELTVPIQALVLISVGLVLLLILIGLVSYFLFFRAKRPLVQMPPPAPPPRPVSPMVTIDNEAGDHTIVDYYPIQTSAKKENAIRQAALIVVAGQPTLSQAKFSLNKPEIKIGRNTQETVNDIPIEDREVSRSHAQIVYRNQQYFIQDLGSSTGTSVNGVKLKAFQETILQNGAEVAIGPKVKFKFVSMLLPYAPDVTVDDYSGDKFRTEEDSDDDAQRTLFDYDPRK